jgi:hypothetical protein
MSRAPANETHISSINSALSPFGVIDWAENAQGIASQVAPPGGVVGGPPAYLDAHGIRYVPTTSLESVDEVPEDTSVRSTFVPMSRGAESAQVSQRELNSRVDDRIRRFMAAKGDLTSRSYASDVSARSYASDLSSKADRGSRPDTTLRERSARLQQIRDRIRAAERDLDDDNDYRRGRARSAVDDRDIDSEDALYRSRSRNDPRGMEADLRALRRQMEDEVAAVKREGELSASAGRKMSQSATSRVSRAREELQRVGAIDF